MREQIHGGDIYRNERVIDFSVNSNPFGAPETVRKAVRESAAYITQYPDVQCSKLRDAISRFESVSAEEIVCGNGAAELFFAVTMALMPHRALVAAPAFAEYERALRAARSEIIYYELKEEQQFDVTEEILSQITEELDLVFLCNPNNPTGRPVEKKLLKQIVKRCETCGVYLVLDECFVDFMDDPFRYEMKDSTEKYPHLFIVKAFTKIFGVPGLRLGYGISGNQEFLKNIQAMLQPWNISVPAQAGGVAALEDCEDYIKRTREYVSREREYMKRELRSLGYTVYDSKANYIFFSGAAGLYEKALEAGFLIRDCQNYRTLAPGYYRIAVRTKDENEQLLAWLRREQPGGAVHG